MHIKSSGLFKLVISIQGKTLAKNYVKKEKQFRGHSLTCELISLSFYESFVCFLSLVFAALTIWLTDE
jgi:hypothetical protein